MRRKVSLYIDGALADLDSQALILYNYALTDLAKPTAVKNSYSKQVTLPGTPANDAIFGHAYRSDRSTGSGFNALTRTPFVLYNELGEIVQSGYLKLDQVKREGSTHSYTVTLYGGLGSFLYNLMYNDDGSTRTLADMSYYFVWPDSTSENYHDPRVVDLSRTFNAAMINTSWLRIDDYDPSSTPRASYRVLNFAPCYNGFPEDFDSDKAIVYPSTIAGGIPDTLTDDEGTVFSPYEGWGLAQFVKQYDEWSIRDLRSYLQRPILNIKAFLDSLSMAANNGGYSVEWKVRPPAERDLWLTLKRPAEIEWSSGTETQTWTNSGTSLVYFPTVHSKAQDFTVEATGTTDFALTVQPEVFCPLAANYSVLWEAWDRLKKNSSTEYETAAAATLMQIIAYDSNGAIKGRTPVYIFTNATTRKTLAEVAADVWDLVGISNLEGGGFLPVDKEDVGYVPVSGRYVRDTNTGRFVWNTPVNISLQASRVAKIRVLYGRLSDEHQQVSSDYYAFTGWNITYGIASRRAGYNGYYQIRFSGTASTTTSAIRSGVTVAQTDLLNSSHSIGDYFLSLAKSFGWFITCDEPAKKVTIWDRNSFFNTGEDAIDLTDRVDRSKGITVTPLYASARIYTFAPEAVGGKADEYADKFGREYGAYRVNTGYEFNDEAEPLADGIVFKTAVWWLARGRDYTWPYIGTDWHFNFEQDGYDLTYGGKGTNAYTKTIPPIFATTWTSYGTLAFADLFDKPQFQDAEGKGVAGEDCLLYMVDRSEWFYQGTELYQLTDDNDMMYYLNGDKPCWIVAFNSSVDGVYAVVDGSSVPQFLPYKRATGSDEYTAPWLSFGIPAEIYDPLIPSWDNDETLYGRYWREYLRDLLNQDTKIMKCRVLLDGLQVGPELMRRFFFYEGTYWVLNKITNYSLTTYDPAECEFVQVRDMNNYTSGQTW